MVLPLLVPAIIGASTIASLATPFFFPTPQEKATIELNNQLKEGNFTIIKKESEIKVPSFGDKLSQGVDTVKKQLDNPKNSIFIIIAIVLIIGVVLLR